MHRHIFPIGDKPCVCYSEQNDPRLERTIVVVAGARAITQSASPNPFFPEQSVFDYETSLTAVTQVPYIPRSYPKLLQFPNEQLGALEWVLSLTLKTLGEINPEESLHDILLDHSLIVLSPTGEFCDRLNQVAVESPDLLRLLGYFNKVRALGISPEDAGELLLGDPGTAPSTNMVLPFVRSAYASVCGVNYREHS